MACFNLSRSLNHTLLGSSLLNIILVLGGCVGIDDFKTLKREAEGLALELRMEQLRAQELDGKVHRLNEKVRELERAAQATHEETARRERE